MGIGDAPLPVGSGVEANNPVPQTGNDTTNKIDARLKTVERSMLTEITQQVTDLITRINDSQGTFVVATTVPFTVFLDGSAVAVSGLKHVGSSYIVGTTGRYIRDTGDTTPSVQKPLCFPTA